MTTSDQAAMPPIMATIKEAADALRVSRGTIYNAINDGALQSVKLGRRHLIPYDELKRFGLAGYAGRGVPGKVDSGISAMHRARWAHRAEDK
jgi:excisionase family DNA binding protein